MHRLIKIRPFFARILGKMSTFRCFAPEAQENFTFRVWNSQKFRCFRGKIYFLAELGGGYSPPPLATALILGCYDSARFLAMHCELGCSPELCSGMLA